MNKLLLMPLALLAVISSTSCANPSIVNINNEYLSQAIFKKIYVPKFSGRDDYANEGTDMFIYTLKSNAGIEVVEGGNIKAEDSEYDEAELLLQKAKSKNADILIIGHLTSHSGYGLLNGFSTVKVYDVHTGNKIANFHRPSGLLIANSEHQCVLAAVEKTAHDFLSLIK